VKPASNGTIKDWKLFPLQTGSVFCRYLKLGFSTFRIFGTINFVRYRQDFFVLRFHSINKWLGLIITVQQKDQTQRPAVKKSFNWATLPRNPGLLSYYKVYAYIDRHNYVLGGMLFTICKAQLHVSAINTTGMTHIKTGLLCCGLRTWGRTSDRMCVKLHSEELRICYYLRNVTPVTSVRKWH
jgi:hypothetical protein